MGVCDFASFEKNLEKNLEKTEGTKKIGTAERVERVEKIEAKEAEAAYRNKKRFYNPVRLVQDDEPMDNAEWGSESSPLSEWINLSFVCPLAVCFIQLTVPAIFLTLLPGSSVWFLNVAVLGLSYAPALLTRFVVLKRPVKNFATALFLFPVTLVFADLCFSVILRSFFSFSFSFSSFFSLPVHKFQFEYIPVFYVAGWSLFIFIYAHCAILQMSFDLKKHIPLLWRVTAYTLTLMASVALSVLLCIANGQLVGPSPLLTDPSALGRQTFELSHSGVFSRDAYLFWR